MVIESQTHKLVSVYSNLPFTHIFFNFVPPISFTTRSQIYSVVLDQVQYSTKEFMSKIRNFAGHLQRALRMKNLFRASGCITEVKIACRGTICTHSSSAAAGLKKHIHEIQIGLFVFLGHPSWILQSTCWGLARTTINRHRSAQILVHGSIVS